MRPMFLSEVEQRNPAGAYARLINELGEAGQPVPQIMHLFAYKPEQTDFLSRYTQSVMRGPSPLPAGIRELIAAFTSRRNDCRF
jgi:alkylhydroperoxidase family enzyme